jgi:phage FluMu gp28-like protein
MKSTSKFNKHLANAGPETDVPGTAGDGKVSKAETTSLDQNDLLPRGKTPRWRYQPPAKEETKPTDQSKNRLVSKVLAQAPPEFSFRPYQKVIFDDHISGTLVLHWSRQIGKSFTLANWAVDRLLKQLQNHPTWLITVLSNSRDNGAEFVLKCHEATNKLKERLSRVEWESEDASPDLDYANMRMEIRVNAVAQGVERLGRIKVLAANPRTARGFSGDLILDEFAFHEDSNAIWEAAEPILSSNPEFLCRIASTGNGKHNMFYRLAAGAGPNDGTVFLSAAGLRVSRVTRTAAWHKGVAIYDANTRQTISPEAARQAALDKRAYDQNYECRFNDENMCLLTHELIQQAERGGLPIDEQAWSAATMARLQAAEGDLYLGGDIGRSRDLTVFAVLEKVGRTKRLLALLRLGQMRLPAQQLQLEQICRLPKFRLGCLDMTGLGLGLVEYAQETPWGRAKITGIHFSATEPINEQIRAEGRKTETARITEIMATDLLAHFEQRSLELCVELDNDAREDLRKPEKLTSPGGRVSIAACRDEAGHADHFWALALAVRAAAAARPAPQYARCPDLATQHHAGHLGLGCVSPLVRL